MSIITAITLKNGKQKCWLGCREIEMLVHCFWECKLVEPLWKNSWQFLKRLNMDLPYDTSPSVADRSGRQTISKDVVELNSTINQLDLIDIYITFHPTKAKLLLFQAHTPEP